MTVWEQRDLPVLSALASTDDQEVRSGFLDISLAQETLGIDLTSSAIHDSIRRTAPRERSGAGRGMRHRARSRRLGGR